MINIVLYQSIVQNDLLYPFTKFEKYFQFANLFVILQIILVTVYLLIFLIKERYQAKYMILLDLNVFFELSVLSNISCLKASAEIFAL